MADALRAGVAARRAQLNAEGSESEAARLRALGDLEGLPPLAGPGPAAPLVKGARAVLQGFLRPWLATQTIFNRELARLLDEVMTIVRDLRRRMPHFEHGMRSLEARIQQLEAERGHPRAAAAGRDAPEAVSARHVERMFVLGRLPRPPARILALGPATGAVAADIASFGFDVSVLNPGSGPPAHPRLHVCRAADGVLPFADGAFDVVIGLSGSESAPADPLRLHPHLVSESARVLGPGGRLLMAISSSDLGALAGDAPGARFPLVLPPPLRVIELMFAVREGQVWNVRASMTVGERSVAPSESGIALIAAERPDAPGR